MRAILNMHTKIGSLVVDLQGLELSQEDKEILNHPLVGGVILFTRNYQDKNQLKNLCDSIRKSRKLPTLIMVDQEGGRVQRFRDDFFALPSLSLFGEWYDKNPAVALELAKSAGWLMAHEIIHCGMDISLAPVVDLNKGLSSVIGTRAFHANRDIVAKLAGAYIAGMHEAGMTATIKHFPGHGSVAADSHLAIPVDERTLKEVLEDDAEPFRQLIQQGVKAILAAHIIFPQIDTRQVSFSRTWLQQILRETLHFNGVIISDCLSMQGADISADYGERVIAAREAGCDIALLCNNRPGVIQALDHVPAEKHQISPDKWQSLQANTQTSVNTLERIHTTQTFLQAHMG
jgi:beta-N-acetylhexosaminidase